MLNSLSRTFVTGLITLLPVLLTIYLLYWLVRSAETLLGGMIKTLLPLDWYLPGMGVIAGLAVVFLVGLMMHLYVIQRLFTRGEAVLYHLPLIKSIYQAMRDFFNFFSPGKEKDFEQVVAVTLGDDMRVIGFVTQADPDRIPVDDVGPDHVLVYVPMSYMIGGFTVLMPRSALTPVDMNMEQAMRFTLTAGITGKAE